MSSPGVRAQQDIFLMDELRGWYEVNKSQIKV